MITSPAVARGAERPERPAGRLTAAEVALAVVLAASAAAWTGPVPAARRPD